MSRHQYPHKKNADEFESLVKELCKKAYGIEFQLYGRNGVLSQTDNYVIL